MVFWHNGDMVLPPNKIFINKQDIIEIALAGDQDIPTIERIVREIRALHEQLKRKEKPLLLMADMTHLGTGTARMRKYSADQLKTLPIKKFALFAGTPFMRNVARFIVIAAGKSKNVQAFKNREEAITWLLE
jgi:hypothetical protein